MKAAKAPAFMFYTGDWLKDPCLSLCSPATRGIWIDALSRMHELRGGSLTGTPDQLARALRCSVADLQSALHELKATEAADVRYSNGMVTLINRRMAREEKARVDAALRKRRYDERHGVTHAERSSNGEVTPPSSSSSSSSAEEEPPKPPKGGRVQGKYRTVEEALQHPLPLILQVPEFADSWRAWLTYLHEKGKLPTMTQIEYQLERCVGFGVERAVAAIKNSITNGWVGLFDKQDKAGPGRRSISTKDYHAEGF